MNPSVKPIALDNRAKATDPELTPLPTHAGKCMGCAMERGKLSMGWPKKSTWTASSV